MQAVPILDEKGPILVFQRRDRRGIMQLLRDLVWPKGGWLRAVEYIKLRIRRLPDPPERIARGIWAGFAVTFTPFIGVHFVVGGLLAWVLRGNVLAAVLATFISNFLTLPIFGAISLRIGYWLMDMNPERGLMRRFLQRFAEAGQDLWKNIKAIFGPAETNWEWLAPFYAEIFLPYLVGGLIPGVLLGTVGYYISVPVIRAYQNRRRGMLAEKLAELRKAALRNSEDGNQG